MLWLTMVLWYCFNQNINFKLKFVLTVFDFAKQNQKQNRIRVSQNRCLVIIPGIPVGFEDVPLQKQVLYTKHRYLN